MRNMLFLSVSAITLGITSQTFAENVATSNELITAVQNGGNVNITQDITLGGDLGTAGANLNIEGNNHMITSNLSDANLKITADQNFSAENLTFKDFSQSGESAAGGVLNNQGNISTLKNVTFENNKAESSYTYIPTGGAIANNGKINTIDGAKFLNNFASYGYGDSASGGAIYNTGTITNITNTAFEGNSANNGKGGAIYNDGTIGNLNGNFTNNYAESGTGSANGGAIFNNEDASIASISGTFTKNQAKEGGAIYNDGTIENINADFSENTTTGSGGAIYSNNKAKINSITGTFTKNSADYGGAIANYATSSGSEANINTIAGNFIENSALTDGGAIYNLAPVKSINANFKNNHADDRGGAIHADHGSIENITGTFEANSASTGGAIATFQNSNITNLEADFIGNNAQADGGAIYNYSQIENIKGNFVGNYVIATEDSNARGGALYNYYSKIGTIQSDFKDNYTKSNSGDAQGGAIFAIGTPQASRINQVLNSNFINNHVEGGEQSNGGAIYSYAPIDIVADNGKSEFTGNYVISNGTKSENAIFMARADSILTLNAKNNGQIIFNDEIDGREGYKLNITGDERSQVNLNNDVRNADITLDLTNVNLERAAYLSDNDSLTINSGHLNLAQLSTTDSLQLNSLALHGGDINVLSADVDLAAQKMGQISANNIEVTGGSINVNKLNLTTESTEEVTKVQFASGDLANIVDNTVSSVTAPVYVYSVDYDKNTGEFTFTRPNSSNASNFNPGVFGGDVLAMSGLNLQSGIVNQITDAAGTNMANDLDYTRARVWATPYLSDDTIDYKNFFDVDSRQYGLVAGVDSKAYGYANDLSAVYTVFGAYNNGEDKYQGVKVENDSWLLGLKASLYKGNFYGDAIVNYAWHDGKIKTTDGSNSIDATGYGAALKAGYKFGEPCDRWKFDTSMMLSWQRVNGDDYTTKSGAKIKSDDFSRLTLTPQIKVGYRALKYWTPYALVRYNFILSEDGSSTANNIDLPELESKGYVEYGIGVETTNIDHHSGYAHALRHDGGRSGWSFTAGYRYNF